MRALILYLGLAALSPLAGATTADPGATATGAQDGAVPCAACHDASGRPRPGGVLPPVTGVAPDLLRRLSDRADRWPDPAILALAPAAPAARAQRTLATGYGPRASVPARTGTP